MKRNIKISQKRVKKANRAITKKEGNIIKKYLKRLGGSYTYKFSSPWRIDVYYDTCIFDNTRNKHFESEPDDLDGSIAGIYDDAVQMIEGLFNDDAEMLAQILFDDTNIPADLSIKVDGNNIITTLFTKKELSNEELDIFMDWFEGQCSDGWGESLEQESIDKTTYYGTEALDFLEDINEGISEYASDNIEFEEWCEYKGYDIPEEDTEEYDDLYEQYNDEHVDIQIDTNFYIKMWPKNFKISKI